MKALVFTRDDFLNSNRTPSVIKKIINTPWNFHAILKNGFVVVKNYENGASMAPAAPHKMYIKYAQIGIYLILFSSSPFAQFVSLTTLIFS